MLRNELSGGGTAESVAGLVPEFGISLGFKDNTRGLVPKEFATDKLTGAGDGVTLVERAGQGEGRGMGYLNTT